MLPLRRHKLAVTALTLGITDGLVDGHNTLHSPYLLVPEPAREVRWGVPGELGEHREWVRVPAAICAFAEPVAEGVEQISHLCVAQVEYLVVSTQ